MIASFNYPDNPFFFALSFVLVFGSPVAALLCVVGHIRAILGADRLSRPVLVLLVVGSLAFGAVAVSMAISRHGLPTRGFDRAFFWMAAVAGGLLPLSLWREWRK